ncbi:DUF4958 family protein [Bacteroides gallinaceum]|uniref:surface glycan-binding family protein n=1 Tax=Bacteroides gallinaceum TaxID=1462571 RepID=UPI0025A31E69|nr:surface glycan-binding family protein [Bacteroides gallinaceum]MDM8207435.1 DUF4958 family protein [Bacteroides gallinaceum]
MKLKRQHFSSGFLAILMLVLMAVSTTSCKDTETVDTSGFQLHYTSMTDIAPSMSGYVIANPSYKGLPPSDFAITRITFGEEGEAYTGDSFQIDASSGSIEILNTDNLSVGVYRISVSCVSGGTTYSFPDIVEVNFLKPVPDGIVVEPNLLTADYNDILDANSEAEMPTAQVTTDNSAEHITITGYAISNVRRGDVIYDNTANPLFAISETGEISIVKGHDEATETNLVPGVYTIDLKLNTRAADANSELGIYTDALQVNVISAPRGLSYADGYVEAGDGTSEHPMRGFTSEAPVLRGSAEGANYAIVAVKRNGVEDESAMAKFSIDAATGIITVSDDHGFVIDDVYTVDVSVTNAYSAEGEVYVGEDALTITVVDWVSAPISLSYGNVSAQRLIEFTASPEYEGGTTALVYSFDNLDESLADYLSIDSETGVISAAQMHEITPGDYTVVVKASNFVGEITGTMNLHVDEHPCYFTYIRYGNNLGLDETTEASQFRFHSLSEIQSMGTITPTTDINPNSGATVRWSSRQVIQSAGITVDENSGVLNLGTTADNWEGENGRQLPVVFVTATAALDGFSYSRTVPVFFHFSKPYNNASYNIENVTVEYTPFVFHVSPQRGGRSAVPVITGIADYSTFYMDYRRAFNYYNLNGVKSDGTPFVDGQPNASGGSFMQNMWIACGNGSNLGQKTPVSFFQSNGRTPKTDPTSNTLLYVDNTAGSSNKYSVVVNPNMWYDDGWADGVFHGQITITNIGLNAASDLNNAVQTFPIAIWFDKSLN